VTGSGQFGVQGDGGNIVQTGLGALCSVPLAVAYPGFFWFWGFTPGISSGGGGGSSNSVKDRGQRERGSGGGSPPVRGSTQFANE
jgi:hypothetical protein